MIFNYLNNYLKKTFMDNKKPKKMETLNFSGNQSWAEQVPALNDDRMYIVYSKHKYAEEDIVTQVTKEITYEEARTKLIEIEKKYLSNVTKELKEQGKETDNCIDYGIKQGFIDKPSKKNYRSFNL